VINHPLQRLTCEIQLWYGKNYVMITFVNINGQILTVSWKKKTYLAIFKVFKAAALFYRLFTTFTNHLWG